MDTLCRYGARWATRCAILLLAATISGCGGGSDGSSAATVTPVTVSVTIDSNSIASGASAHLKASVTNDPVTAGVSWSLSCSTSDCGRLDQATSASGQTVTYTAPSNTTPNDLVVTITATSSSDKQALASVQVKVAGGAEAITSIKASANIVPTGHSVQVAAFLVNDTHNAGVTWIMSCNLAACGTLSAAQSTSGANVTYTAPATIPLPGLAVTLTATAVSDPSAHLAAVIQVTAPGGTLAITAIDLSATFVPAGQTAQVAAFLVNDAHNAGVSWQLTCDTTDCGTLVPLKSTSGVYVTYTAPAAVPAAGITVTFAATAVSDPSVQATRTMPVTATGGVLKMTSIEVSGNPVLAGHTAQLAVTLDYDTQNAGVTWNISCSASDCGSFSPNHSTSGIFVTYHAPAAIPPQDLAVTVTVTAVSDPSVATTYVLTVAALSVKVVLPVNPSVINLVAGTSVPVMAVANYPEAVKSGFTWSVKCAAADCGRESPTSSLSDVSVIFTAPAAAPAQQLVVTLTATAVDVPALAASLDLSINAISVGVVPISALIPRGQTVAFTGKVYSDPGSGDLQWSVLQGGSACQTGCGTLSVTSTPNGGSVDYTAPGAVPATHLVYITAASATDRTKTAAGQVTLTNGTVQLVPLSLRFLKVRRGGECCIPKPQSVTMTNTARTALNIDHIAIEVTGTPGFRQSNNCGTRLSAGASCTITVNWTLGIHDNASVAIYDSSPDSPQRIALSSTTVTLITASMRASLATTTALQTPRPSGSNVVGTQTLYFTDQARVDALTAGSQPRELAVRFWYPASTAGACVSAAYTPAQVWRYYAALLGTRLPAVSTHSCQGAVPAGGALPVVILEHGYTGSYTDYTFLAEDLASRGYMVIAPNHTHEATAAEMADGRLELSVFGSHLTRYARTDEGALGIALAVRLDDIHFLLDELQRRSAPGAGLLGAQLDLSHIVMIGHSLGGLATVRALQAEPRIRAGILLDAVPPPFLDRPINQPVLTLMAGRERWNADDCMLWHGMKGARYAIALPSAADHAALSDEVWLLRGFIGTGAANADDTIAFTRDTVAGFVDDIAHGAQANRAPRFALRSLHGALMADQNGDACPAP